MSYIDLDTFVFFGCWNNIDCEYKYLYRDIVLQSIKLLETETNNVFIAGDNWYNLLVKNSADLENIITKEIKSGKPVEITHYLTPILISGYYTLYNMNKNIYICVGNHDEAEDEQEDIDPVIQKGLKKNCMIETQKYYLKNINNSIKANPIDNKNYIDYSEEDVLTYPAIQFIHNDKPPSLEQLNQLAQLEEEYTLELEKKHENMNEIKLYSGDHIEIVDNNEAAYIVVIINTNILSLEYIYRVAMRIERKLSEYDNDTMGTMDTMGTKASKGKPAKKQLFVMGHIPLFSDKKNQLNKNKEMSEDILEALYDMLVKYNSIYLCADTHNFNIMKITNQQNSKSLIQITCGTGGAKPDLIEEKIGLDYLSNPTPIKNYYIYYNSINSYGYCSISIKQKEIVVVYNKIIDALKQKEETQEMHYSRYFYIIKNNDVSYYTVRENRELFKNIEENIEKIANVSKLHRDIYCADDYMNMNHVIKSEKNATDKQVICFNKAYKKEKKNKKK